MSKGKSGDLEIDCRRGTSRTFLWEEQRVCRDAEHCVGWW